MTYYMFCHDIFISLSLNWVTEGLLFRKKPLRKQKKTNPFHNHCAQILFQKNIPFGRERNEFKARFGNAQDYLFKYHSFSYFTFASCKHESSVEFTSNVSKFSSDILKKENSGRDLGREKGELERFVCSSNQSSIHEFRNIYFLASTTVLRLPWWIRR